MRSFIRLRGGLYGLVLGAAAALVALPVRSQAPSFDLVAESLGPVRAVRVAGDYLYAGVHHQLKVYAIGGADRLKLVHEAKPLEAPVNDLRVDGQRLYLAAGEAGLVVYDLADPARPRQASVLRGHGLRPVGVTAQGDTLYTASGRSGLHAIDVSNAFAPRIVAELKEGATRYQHVVLQGSHLYATDGDRGFLVYDAAPGTSPVRLGAAMLAHGAEQVVVEGTHAYVAAGRAGLRVVDLADPAHPVEVGGSLRDRHERAVGVALAGTFALVADQSTEGGEGRLHRGGLRVIDISDPKAPRQRSNVPGDLVAVAATAKRAYAGVLQPDIASSIDLYDVSHPASPRRLATAWLPLTGGAVMRARGDQVLISSSTLSRYGFDKPGHPRRRWDLPLADPPPRSPFQSQLALGEGVAFVHEKSGVTAVIDLSDFDRPRRAAGLRLSAYPIAAGGHLGFLKPYGAKVLVVDAVRPDDPVVVGELPDSRDASHAVASGSHLYLVDRLDSTLNVYDIGDPAHPVLANRIRVPPAFALEVVGDVLYLGADMAGAPDALLLYSLAHAPQVEPLGSVSLQSGYARFLSVCDGVAYVSLPTQPGGGVQAIDVSDPGQPRLTARHEPQGLFTWELACLPGGIVVTEVDEGVQVLRYRPEQARFGGLQQAPPLCPDPLGGRAGCSPAVNTRP